MHCSFQKAKFLKSENLCYVQASQSMWTVSLKWNSQANSLSAYHFILECQKRCSYLGFDRGFTVLSLQMSLSSRKTVPQYPKPVQYYHQQKNQAVLASTQLEPRKLLSVYSIITTSNEGLHVITISFQTLLCEYCCIILISRTTCIGKHLFFDILVLLDNLQCQI